MDIKPDAGWLSRAVGWTKALIPVVIKYVPQLAGWGSVLYVVHDMVLWALKYWGL
jgi:hypothetical protein